jgi:hypothetical protein
MARISKRHNDHRYEVKMPNVEVVNVLCFSLPYESSKLAWPLARLKGLNVDTSVLAAELAKCQESKPLAWSLKRFHLCVKINDKSDTSKAQTFYTRHWNISKKAQIVLTCCDLMLEAVAICLLGFSDLLRMWWQRWCKLVTV